MSQIWTCLFLTCEITFPRFTNKCSCVCQVTSLLQLVRQTSCHKVKLPQKQLHQLWMTNSFADKSCGLLAIIGDQIEVVLSGSTDDIYRPQHSWGKTIFSQASVIPSTEWCAWFQGGLVPGVSGSGGVSDHGGAWWRPPRTATAAGGTYPTEMHSCPLVTSETYLYNGFNGFRI